MPLPDAFKYDQRVRMRYLRKGQLTESELEKHLLALKDVATNAATVELKQPAFQTEAERQNTIVVRPAPVRPAISVPVDKNDLYDEIDDEIDDEDDDDELEDADEEETTVVQGPKVEPALEAKPVPPPSTEEEPAPGSGPRGSAGEHKKDEETDDGWG